MIRCSYERLTENGAYVIGKQEALLDEHCLFRIMIFLENGLVMYIWLGSQVNPLFVQSLFGLQTAAHIQPEKVNESVQLSLEEFDLFPVSYR